MIGPAGSMAGPKASATGGAKYPLFDVPQTIEYDVLHALEAGATQVVWIHKHLRRAGISRTPRQISGALQRLQKDGLCTLDRGLWVLMHNDRCNRPA